MDAMMMACFDATVNCKAIMTKEKQLEMVYWFNGSARRIIVCLTMHPDKQVAYMLARTQMDKLFKANCNSFVMIVNNCILDRGESSDQPNVEEVRV